MSTGTEYLADITRRKADLVARAAFVELALALVKPGTSILDFGAGPGLDAKCYAQRGFRVLTYDIDPEMCRCLGDACRQEIVHRQVVPCAEFHLTGPLPLGEYAAAQDISLITANFAPFNLIQAPERYFRQFHQLLNRGGMVLLSVLNPCFVGDVRYGWWWGNILRLMRNGEYAVAGDRGPIYRRSAARLQRQASPYFRLRAERGGLRGHGPALGRVRGVSQYASQYLFLVFEKCQ